MNNYSWNAANKGAMNGGEMESAQAKNQALKDAGAVVPTSYEALEGAIKETFQKLVSVLALPSSHLLNFNKDRLAIL